MITIEPSCIYDAHTLAPNLRPEDIREVTALGVEPLDALRGGTCGAKCFTAFVGGEPVGMFGVTTHPVDVSLGIVWLLASEELFSRDTYQFLRDSRRWLLELESGYTALYNIADPRNHKHIKWLRFLGFTFLKHHFGLGRNGETYIDFIKPCANLPS